MLYNIKVTLSVYFRDVEEMSIGVAGKILEKITEKVCVIDM